MATCKYRKYGNCKFGKTCRFQHNDELCQDLECEISSCSKRHPKRCKYYQEFKRCKFGEFCSFIHEEFLVIDSHENYQLKNDLNSMKSKLCHLEDIVSKQSNEVTMLKTEIEVLKEDNEKLKFEISNQMSNIETVTEKVVKQTDEIIITQLKSQQDAMEVQTNNRFNTLHTEIQALLKAFNLKPSSSLPQPASTRNGSRP